MSQLEDQLKMADSMCAYPLPPPQIKGTSHAPSEFQPPNEISSEEVHMSQGLIPPERTYPAAPLSSYPALVGSEVQQSNETMHQGPPVPPPYPQEGEFPPGSSHAQVVHPPQSSQGVYIAPGDVKQTIGGYPASLWNDSSVPAATEDRQAYGHHEEAYIRVYVVKGFEFDNPSIRRGFLRKVYGILSVQLAITLSFICWFLFDRTTKQFVQTHPQILILSMIVVLVSLLCLAFCGDLRRKPPMNYIILILFTLAESLMLGVITSRFDVDTVALAVGMTAILCFGLTLFAFQTKFDFTICGGMLFVSLLLLVVFGIAFACIHTKLSSLLYASLGALLFSAYLVYDTQIMMGGDHQYSISPEEYIFAAINLYVDIINLFLRILMILRHFR